MKKKKFLWTHHMGHRVHGEVDVVVVGTVAPGLVFLVVMSLRKEGVVAVHLWQQQEILMLWRQPQEKSSIG
jgi:hypothetical protein